MPRLYLLGLHFSSFATDPVLAWILAALDPIVAALTDSCHPAILHCSWFPTAPVVAWKPLVLAAIVLALTDSCHPAAGRLAHDRRLLLCRL